jgi:hypothetical protein
MHAYCCLESGAACSIDAAGIASSDIAASNVSLGRTEQAVCTYC